MTYGIGTCGKVNSPVIRMAQVVEWVSHLFAYAFAMHFLFGAVSVLNASGLGFFFYYPRTIDIILIDSRIDILVWAASVACLSILSAWFSRGRQRRPVQVSLALTAVILSIALLATLEGLPNKTAVYMLFTVATAEFVLLAVERKHALPQSRSALAMRVPIYFLATLSVIEVSSATHYILQSFDRTTQIGLVDAGIELQLSYAPYALLPWLYVAFLFSWAWVPLVHRLLQKISHIQRHPQATITNQGLVLDRPLTKRLAAMLDPKLLFAIVVAIFIGYYPYFRNPPWLVGTDANWVYYGPLLRVNAKGVLGGFLQALSERHPVALAVLYAAQLTFQTTAFQAVRFAPLGLIVLLAVLMWWFLARNGTSNLGLIVFLLSVFSVTTTVGLFSSILANWMALLVWVAFFAYTGFRGDEGFRIPDLIVLLMMSTLILFLHPWTWGVFAASVLLAAIAALLEERRKGLRGAAMLISVLVVDLALAVLSLTLLNGSQGWRLLDAVRLYVFVINKPSSLLFFWDALNRLIQVWAAFFSPLYLAISILGVICLTFGSVTPWRRRLILAWVCASAVGSVLVAPIGFNPAQPARGESQLWRLFFLTPFQVTAPFGIAWLSQLPHRFLKIGVKHNVENSWTIPRAIWLAALITIGVLLAWTPIEALSLRTALLLVSIPAVTALLLTKSKGAERKFLSEIILAGFLLVAFNSTTRALSQLLIDPHNCTRC